MKHALAVMAGGICLIGNLCAATISDDALRFHAADGGGFTFDTGALRGTLRPGGKSDGLMSVVHVPSGTTLDRSKGLFGLYRVFTTNWRYGGGAWDWESTATLRADGSVEALWPAAAERPFEIRAIYRWSDAATLDLELKVNALEPLQKFELFLASYFNEPFTNTFVMAKDKSFGVSDFVPARADFGTWQCFPRDDAAATIVQDGRWKIPPSPVEWVIRPHYAAPLAYRKNPTTGLSALVMAPRNDCFAVLTPEETEKHNSLYLSLFGRDLKRGETAVAHARLTVAETISSAKAQAIYGKFLKSLAQPKQLSSPRFSKGEFPRIITHDYRSGETSNERDQRLAWWREGRFGLFIHWGPVSLKGTEIGWSRGREVPVAEYDHLYTDFNPQQFNAKQWVAIAKAAGVKYLVLTAKHHDGFCLWDTKLSDYNITRSPFHRDVIKELSAECRRQNIRFCIYYSVLDWHHSDYPLGEAPGGGTKTNPNMDRYVGYMKGQLGELIRNYGPLGLVWFDGDWEQPWSEERGADLYQWLRERDRNLIINNRLAKVRDNAGMNSGRRYLGDYGTPEQRLGQFNRDVPWETCMTLGKQWAWKPNDEVKSLEECLRSLITCAGCDGNLLLNVGPMPSGEIESRQAARLSEIGQWLQQYGTTIYNTRGGPWRQGETGVSTCRGKTVYVHIFQWPSDSITLSALPAKVLRSSVLTGGNASVRQTNDGVEISVSRVDRHPVDTIVALKLDSRADEIEPVPWMEKQAVTK